MRTVFAPAKVNLWLRIFAPDATGYHPLDTLFCAIDLADELDIEQVGTGISLQVEGAELGPAERNLALRAAREFYRATGLREAVRMTLRKRVPAGAGLGGGSSDAAAVLQTLNELYAAPLAQQELLAIGARLGSDVAFFLCGSALARGTGYGQLLEAQPPLPRAPLLLLVPAFAIATPDAYRWLDECRGWSQPAAAPDAASWDAVARCAVNDFEPVLHARYPDIGALLAAVRASGARMAALSGSGSALFGVYEDERSRRQAALMLQGRHGARVIETVTR